MKQKNYMIFYILFLITMSPLMIITFCIAYIVIYINDIIDKGRLFLESKINIFKR